MTLNFLVAPDFSPEHFAGWHMLNTTLQRRANIRLHLLTPTSATEQTQLIQDAQVDLIYANPFDAAHMVRSLGYLPFARPVEKYDEMVIACSDDSTLLSVEDLRRDCKIALTDNKDVKLIGLRLLEPADLAEDDVQWVLVDNHQAAARLLLKGAVNAAFFLSDTYRTLSRLTRSQLRVLVESAIHDISHVLLVHPRMIEQLPVIRTALLSLDTDKDADLLSALGLPKGFEPMSDEQTEFMIDLMETLLD